MNMEPPSFFRPEDADALAYEMEQICAEWKSREEYHRQAADGYSRLRELDGQGKHLLAAEVFHSCLIRIEHLRIKHLKV